LNDKKYLKGSKFQHHVNAWLSYIIDGVTIIPVKDSDTHTARITVENAYSSGKGIFPTNTGFGISYSLPIIVSCLLAENNSILIIENPEAHLHPSAQSKMGYFLGVMANAGIKIIVETHSDHIVNGIQIAVAKKRIQNNKVTINYFYKEDKTEQVLQEDKILGVKQQPIVKPILINEKGELTEWPKGFFDQTQIDYVELLNLKKK
jgi:predicted ATPase